MITSNSECSKIDLFELVESAFWIWHRYQYVTVIRTFASPATEAVNLHIYFTQLTIGNEFLLVTLVITGLYVVVVVPPQFMALKGVWCQWMKEVLKKLL